MLEYKEEANFKRILNSLTINDVLYAIQNAERICEKNEIIYQKIKYSSYEYYKENPSLNLHEYIKDILQTVNIC